MITSGVDIIEIARIGRAVKRHGQRFYARFFTEQELEFCGDRVQCLAGRFAVKEAVAKALGTGIGDVAWTEIEVVCDGRGKPELVLRGRAQDLARSLGLNTWSISVSYSKTYAIGFAVALEAKAVTNWSDRARNDDGI